MGRDAFVDASEPIRVDLLDGDWIDCKPELTYGEQQRIATSGLQRIEGMTGVGVDWTAFNEAKIAGWVVDWSFLDKDKKRVRISRDSIASLKPDIAAEILTAIDGHIEAMADRKKTTTPEKPVLIRKSS